MAKPAKPAKPAKGKPTKRPTSSPSKPRPAAAPAAQSRGKPGDRIAIGMGGAIYTFAPDGSNITKVASDGDSPFWSPDGSQIAYTTPSGLAIADADGSNVRTFGFAASGPWHPGQ